MGGVGLSALVLGYLLLPGLGAFFFYNGFRDITTESTPILSYGFSRRVVVFFFVLLVAHSIPVLAAYCVSFFPSVDFTVVGTLLVGSPSPSALGGALENLQANVWLVFLYLVTALGVSLSISRIAAHLRREKPTHWFEHMIEMQFADNQKKYMMGKGRGSHGNAARKKSPKRSAIHDKNISIRVTATVDYDSGTKLISGFYAFVVSEGGRDIGIAITNAMKRDVDDEHSESTENNTDQIDSSIRNYFGVLRNGRRIEGHLFLIRFEWIHTINISFLTYGTNLSENQGTHDSFSEVGRNRGREPVDP